MQQVDASSATTLTVSAPTEPLHGTARLVGDKSISHRAPILGALADGTSTIANLSTCGDVMRTLDCLERLGVTIARAADDPDRVTVHGRGVRGLRGPLAVLDCGDSGTTMRLLAGALVGQDRTFTLDAAPGLARRPMARVVEPLVAMGADIRSTDGHPPLRGRGGGLTAIDHAPAHASAQVGSAVLLAGLNARGTTRVHYPAPVRDHTERMLKAIGARIAWDGATSEITGPAIRLSPLPGADGVYRVPNDPSAAAFLIAAATIVPGSDIRLRKVCFNTGRNGFLDILEAMGAAIFLTDFSLNDRPMGGGETIVDFHLRFARLRATEVSGALVPPAIDELPLVAVVATQAEGRTVVRDAAELRVKECDRIAAIVDGLTRMGARIEARPDGFVVDGPTPLRGAAVSGHADHRIVMALAVAGLVATGETTVTGAERVGDSFPGFVDALRDLGASI